MKSKVPEIVTRDGSVFVNDIQLFDGSDWFWRGSVRSVFEAILKRVRTGAPILCRTYPEGAGIVLCECDCGQLSIFEGTCGRRRGRGGWSCDHHQILVTDFIEGFVRGMDRLVHLKKPSNPWWLNHAPGLREFILSEIAAYHYAVIAEREETGPIWIYQTDVKWKEETGLPMNILIDVAEAYRAEGHEKWIRFQLDKAERCNTKKCGAMDFGGGLHPPKRMLRKLKVCDLEQLRHFVRNNRYALERLADQEIHLYQIWGSMIKGGELASDAEVAALNAEVDKLMQRCGGAEKCVR